jgi:class 3 adenylate cyclase
MDWIEQELLTPNAVGNFYFKLLNAFYYLPVSSLPRNSALYRNLKQGWEELFDLQDKAYCGWKRREESKKVTVVYADMLDTVETASLSSLYSASLILIYRQIFFGGMKSFGGYVDVPIGDSLLAIFDNPQDALDACLSILKYLLEYPYIDAVTGISFGDDFLVNLQGRPILGRDINLAVRLSHLGELTEKLRRSVKVQDCLTKAQLSIKGKVNLGIWMDEPLFREFEDRPEVDNIRVVKYLSSSSKEDRYWESFWKKIGYPPRKIYGVIPNEYFG